MHQHEVLPAGLANDPGIAAIEMDVLTNRLVEGIKGCGGSGKMKSREVPVAEADLAQYGPVDIDEVDYASRQPGFQQNSHKKLRGENLGIGRLPDDGIAAEGSRGRKIAADCGE